MSRRLPATPLPYSKVCDLVGDAPQLAPYLEALDRYPEIMQGQQSVRRWEYAMALRTIHEWAAQGYPRDFQIVDVGGAGAFAQILATLTPSHPVVVIDPTLPQGGTTVEAVAAQPTQHARWDVLTSISVIEHVVEVKRFFRACYQVLRPGGLLFFTTDYWDAEGEDTAHFHWMRQRIYNAGLIQKLLLDLREVGFTRFGAGDWTYNGHQCYDYSVCAIALVKK